VEILLQLAINVHGVKDFKQTKMHTVEPLEPQRSSIEI
jgi:hypothetical protein